VIAESETADHRRRVELMVAGIMAAVLVAAASWLRIAVELPNAAPLPQRLTPTLVALVGLCAVGLLAGRAPRGAWLAATTAAGVATVEILAVLRSLLSETGSADRLPLVAAAAVTGAAAVVVALGYAVSGRRVGTPRLVDRSIALFAIAAVAVSGIATVAALAWATGGEAIAAGADGAEEVGPVRIMNRVLLGVVALGITLGLARDAEQVTARARERIRSDDAPDRPSSLLEALADELVPARRRERQRAAERERARLAADLHATVLPDLRQAASAAELGAVPADVVAGLRRSLEGVERLMNERQSIVLDEFGIVAALEWLAERTEERTQGRTGLVVELELEGDRVAERDAVPRPVARVAFRIALLALDNVVRHAGAGRATVRLSVHDGVVRLWVVDDGARRWDPTTAIAGRGLADMRREATAIGAELSIVSASSGTTVRFGWPAVAGQPAVEAVETTARSNAVGR
jgi:signal transduction histidine kinase